jgi:antirestriction protein ArdC
MSEKVFKIINDQIINALEEGQIPWRKPWVHHNFGPMNAVSNKTYSGINFFLLPSCSLPTV